MSNHRRFTALFMAAIFHLEFVPQADIYKTANYLRTLGITATVVEQPKEMIVVEAESYSKAMEKLTPEVAKLPDIYKWTWLNGDQESVLYQTDNRKNEVFLQDSEITDSIKVIKGSEASVQMTVLLKDDKATTIQYQNLVRKIENMGFKVTFADGYIDAGWMQLPAIEIQVANNIAGVKDALLRIGDLPAVNRFWYNRGTKGNVDEYIVIFEEGVDFGLQISRFLANGVEVYKVDKDLNKFYLHFPSSEARNRITLEKIKSFEGLVVLKHQHENASEYSNPVYAKNVKSVWLDIPDEILRISSNTEYGRALEELTRGQIANMQDRGMIVLHYGYYAENNEFPIPEITFTYRDQDSPKAEQIIADLEQKRSNFLQQLKRPKGKLSLKKNSCVSLFR